MHFSSAIKMIDEITRHNPVLNDSFVVLFDKSDITGTYLQSEMMDCALWYIPIVTDSMMKCHPSQSTCNYKIPNASLVGTSKCPLHTLAGSTAVSYFCPWRLEKGNEIDIVGKIQISLGLYGSITDSLPVIHLDQSTNDYQSIFDWDLPGVKQNELKGSFQDETPKDHISTNENEVMTKMPFQHKHTNGLESSLQEAQLHDEHDVDKNENDNGENFEFLSHVQFQCKSNDLPVSDIHQFFKDIPYSICEAKMNDHDHKKVTSDIIESTSLSKCRENISQADVINHDDSLNVKDILPTPNGDPCFLSANEHFIPPRKANADVESNSLNCKITKTRLETAHYKPEHITIAMPKDRSMQCPSHKVSSCDSSSATSSSFSTQDFPECRFKESFALEKDYSCSFSSDDSSIDMHDERRQRSKDQQQINTSYSSSSSSPYLTDHQRRRISNINTRRFQKDESKRYSCDESSSTDSFSLSHGKNLDDNLNVRRQDGASLLEIESIDFSYDCHDSSSWE
jgi:hypothetical protein